MQTAAGPKEKSVTVKHGADLFALSNEPIALCAGFSVAEINAKPGNELSASTMAAPCGLGEEIGRFTRRRMAHAGQAHRQAPSGQGTPSAGARIKVLSLFFIDRVANYRRL